MEIEPPMLLVEDNDDDVLIFRRALKKAGISRPFQIAMDGQKAIEYLAGKGEFHDREQYPAPAVVFLDLKLPFKSGIEVLQWADRNPLAPKPEIIVLTSSAEERDVRNALQLGARAYLLKPPRPELLRKIAEAVGRKNGAFEFEEDLFRSIRDNGSVPPEKS